MIDYTPFEGFNAEYLANVKLIKEKYSKTAQSLYVLRIIGKKGIMYYNKEVNRVFEIDNATPLDLKFAQSLQKQIAKKTEIIVIK